MTPEHAAVAATALTTAFRARAEGLSAAEAAIDLLTGHATWLRRPDFLHHFVHTIPGPAGYTRMADIDWAAAIAALECDHLPAGRDEPGPTSTTPH